jgi:Tol biopolymer transport system component
MRRGTRTLVTVVVAAALAGASPAGAPATGSSTGRVPAPVTVDAIPAAPSPSPSLNIDPAIPAPLPQPKGKTTLVSANTSGGFASGFSSTPAISTTGRFVAFASSAADLIPGGTLANTAIYLRDRAAGTTIQIPAAGSGQVPRAGYATEPSISADGSVIAFTYQAAQNSEGPSSVEVWQRSTGTTIRVSSPPAGALDASSQPAVSADGKFVAFTSFAPYIVANHTSDYSAVYRFEIKTRKTLLVSVGPGAGGYIQGYSNAPSISGNGRLVAFVSPGGTSVMSGALGKGQQVYLRDVSAGTTSQVSVGPGGAAPDGEAYEPSISDDGQWIAFSSTATTLLGPGGPAIWEIYRRDLSTGENVMVSVQDDGSPIPSPSRQPAISRDGRMVAFVVVGGLNTAVLQRQASAIVLRDVTAEQTALISVTPDGTLSQSLSLYPKVGGGGRYVTFASGGADLVPGDQNKQADVFIRDMPPVPRLNPPVIDFGTRAVGVAPSTAAGVLSNAGWGPMTMKPAALAGANPGDYSVLADGCAGVTLYRGEPCTVTVGFAPTKPGARTAQLQIAMNAPGSPSVLTLKGRGSQALIVLDPPIGPQGIVVVATGDHFPANAEIQLTWSVGMTPTLPVVKADSHGHWSMQVLVFHHDVIGPRNLVATWVGGPEFPTVQVPMLVTVRTVTAPGFGPGGPPFGPMPLLFRG